LAMAGAALIVSGIVAVRVAPLRSNTENVGAKLPEPAGVPLRRPVASIDVPLGRPTADQAGEEVDSPMALSEMLGYGWLTVEAGRLAVAISGVMVSAKFRAAESGLGELSTTCMLKPETVAVFAVPEMAPLEASPRPAGNAPTRVQVYGAIPPEAVSTKEYGIVATPGGKGVVVIVTAAISGDASTSARKRDFRMQEACIVVSSRTISKPKRTRLREGRSGADSIGGVRRRTVWGVSAVGGGGH
jgi:hypothetical protein